MEQKPPVPSQHETQSPTRRQKAETAQTAMRNANEKRTMEGLVGLAPKYRREVVQEEREQDDGTKQIVEVRKRVPLSEEERLQYPKKLLEAYDLKFPTTVADFSTGNSYYGPSDADRQEYEQVIQGAREGLADGDYEPFFAALGQWGPRLLRDPLVNAEVEGWWLTQLNYDASVEAQHTAKQSLQRIGKVLSTTGSGRTPEVTAEVAQQIKAVYYEELARCRTVRKLEKRRWKTPQERHREIGNRVGVSPDEAATLEEEGLHLTPSDWARQRTTKLTGFSDETVRRTLLSPRSSPSE